MIGPLRQVKAVGGLSAYSTNHTQLSCPTTDLHDRSLSRICRTRGKRSPQHLENLEELGKGSHGAACTIAASQQWVDLVYQSSNIAERLEANDGISSARDLYHVALPHELPCSLLSTSYVQSDSCRPRSSLPLVFFHVLPRASVVVSPTRTTNATCAKQSTSYLWLFECSVRRTEESSPAYPAARLDQPMPEH